jgi:hypothetical protein
MMFASLAASTTVHSLSSPIGTAHSLTTHNTIQKKQKAKITFRQQQNQNQQTVTASTFE